MVTHTKPAKLVKSNPGHVPLTPEEKEDIRRQVQLVYDKLCEGGYTHQFFEANCRVLGGNPNLPWGAWVHQFIEANLREELERNHNSPEFQEVSQVIRETSMEILLSMTRVPPSCQGDQHGDPTQHDS